MLTRLLVLLARLRALFLIACANLSNMMFARAAGRRHELAIRPAVGASRARVARQLLTEALLLSICGGAVGLLLSLWGCRWLWASTMEAVQGFVGDELPLSLTLRPDTRVFAYIE